MHPCRLPGTSARRGSGPLRPVIAALVLGAVLTLLPQPAAAGTADPEPSATPTTSTPTSPPPPEVTAAPVRVATYNVCSRRCPRLQSWSRRAERVAAEVARARPDVVTFQETGGRSTRRVLTTRLARQGYVSATGNGGQYTYYRTATISKRDEAEVRLPYLHVRTPHRHAGRHGYAPVHVFRHLGTGARFAVVNYHLPAYDTRARDRARRDEYDAIERALAPLVRANLGVPVIRSGDFNSYVQPNTSRYDSHRHRARVWPRLRADGFVDAARVASSTRNVRHNTIIRAPGDRRRFGPSRHLDHVFVPRGTDVRSWTLVHRAGSYAQQPSDHRLTYADLVLRLP